ncbi:MAG: hypothetical protein ACKOPQ_01375 [Novosphingobium sp.]
MKELLAEIPVPPKMIRHFAVVTVIITACIALFADGERRQAMADEVDQQRQQAELRQAEAAQSGPKQYQPPVVRTGGTGSGFGAEGPVDPGGTDTGGGEVAIRTTGGSGGFTHAGAYDYGALPPDVVALRQGKLPPKTIGPAWQPPKKVPTERDRQNLLRSAEERAGPATEARTQ